MKEAIIFKRKKKKPTIIFKKKVKQKRPVIIRNIA